MRDTDSNFERITQHGYFMDSYGLHGDVAAGLFLTGSGDNHLLVETLIIENDWLAAKSVRRD
jgi:hypothetical protein